MSTKLSNGAEFMNPNFSAEFGNFLLANDFSCQVEKNKIKFHQSDKLLVVINDQIDLYIFHPEQEGQESEKWVFEQSHVGISHFNLFGWIFLMHIMGILKISDFITNSKKAGVQTGTEAAFIVKEAFNGPLKKVLV